MSAVQEGYIVQMIQGRYIRDAILVEFINARRDEFGESWKRTVSSSSCRGNLTAQAEASS